MKIKEITYKSGRVEYVCSWWSFRCVGFPDEGLELFVAVTLIFLYLPAMIFDSIILNKRTFIKKENAIRFINLYYQLKINNNRKKQQEKEQKRLRQLDRKKASVKIISRS